MMKFWTFRIVTPMMRTEAAKFFARRWTIMAGVAAKMASIANGGMSIDSVNHTMFDEYVVAMRVCRKKEMQEGEAKKAAIEASLRTFAC